MGSTATPTAERAWRPASPKISARTSEAPFTGQPGVVNGASDVLAEIFGEAGRHARSAVGVAVLPMDAPVEVEITVRVR